MMFEIRFDFLIELWILMLEMHQARDVTRGPGLSMLGSPLFMPPEMLNYEPHSFPADIFSFGERFLKPKLFLLSCF